LRSRRSAALDNNFQGWGDCIRADFGGNNIIGNRMEVNRRGVVLGVTSHGQVVQRTADNGAGGTRLTIGTTALLKSWASLGQNTVNISPYWGVGANIVGNWTFTVVDATHIDIPVPFQPLPPGDTYRLGVVEQNVSGYRLGASATMVTGNAFEANDFSIFVDAGAGIVMQGNQIQGHQNSPSGMSTAGIYIRGLNAGVIQANVITGGHALGGIYLENGGSQWNNVVQANSIQENLAVTGSYSNTAGPFTMQTGAMGMLPRWLVPGLTVVAIGGFSVWLEPRFNRCLAIPLP
jgi:hypothetical protein